MFRFTIRDVLWLMVVVGLGCLLLVNYRSSLGREEENKELREILGLMAYQLAREQKRPISVGIKTFSLTVYPDGSTEGDVDKFGSRESHQPKSPPGADPFAAPSAAPSRP
jgi:hypothetical protein